MQTVVFGADQSSELSAGYPAKVLVEDLDNAIAKKIGEMNRSPLGQMVAAALSLLSRKKKAFSLVAAELSEGWHADAVIWESSAGEVPDHLLAAPILFVEILRSEASSARPRDFSLQRGIGGPVPDEISVSWDNFDEAARIIAEWIGRVIGPSISLDEQRMLEVVLNAIRQSLDEGLAYGSPHDRAQFRIAADTIEIQLRAPRPSRRVLSWALNQLSNFPGGVLSGLAATYLPELLHRMVGS